MCVCARARVLNGEFDSLTWATSSSLSISDNKLVAAARGWEMSSIGQSIVMALTVTVNKYASSNLQAVAYRKKDPKSPANPAAAATRRGLLLSSLAAAASSSSLSDSRTLLLQSNLLSLSCFLFLFLSHSWIVSPEYRKKSEENREKNDKEVYIYAVVYWMLITIKEMIYIFIYFCGVWCEVVCDNARGWRVITSVITRIILNW